MAMMTYNMTLQYQAERIKTAAEQRRADEQVGMSTAAMSRLWQRATGQLRTGRSSRPARAPGYAR